MNAAGPLVRVKAAPMARAETATRARAPAIAFFDVFILSGPDAVRCGFLVSVADRLGQAFGGLLKLNLRRIKISARIIFHLMKIILQKMIDRREG